MIKSLDGLIGGRSLPNIKANNSLVESLQKFSLEPKTKLLGYLHLQMAKSHKTSDSSILSKALEFADTQELFIYFYRNSTAATPRQQCNVMFSPEPNFQNENPVS